VTISGDALAGDCGLRSSTAGQEPQVAGSPRHLTLGRAAAAAMAAVASRDATVTSFNGVAGSAAVMVIWMVVVPIEHRRDGISGAATKYRALHSRRRNGLLERGSTLCLAQHTSHQNLAYSQDSWQPLSMAIFLTPAR
jgi:hypothetical protein